MSSRDRRRVTVAAAQVSGGIFAPQRAVDRLLDTVDEAADRGASLVVFPECYVGGYPYWRGAVDVKTETELGARLLESAILADGPEVQAMAAKASERGVALVVGVNERDPRPGSASAYNAAFVFDPEHGYAGRHRKLVPTHTERAYWAAGDADDVCTFELSFGVVGTLICYEHHMLAPRMALSLLGEEIHCALWPGYWQTRSHIADKRPGPAASDAEIDATVRDYALSSQSFVVSANAYLADADVPADLRDVLTYNLARGGSAIVDAGGRYLVPPSVDTEGLVVAELDFFQRAVTKSYIDTVGHYARWDLFDLALDGRSLTRGRRDPRGTG